MAAERIRIENEPACRTDLMLGSLPCPLSLEDMDGVSVGRILRAFIYRSDVKALYAQVTAEPGKGLMLLTDSKHLREASAAYMRTLFPKEEVIFAKDLLRMPHVAVVQNTMFIPSNASFQGAATHVNMQRETVPEGSSVIRWTIPVDAEEEVFDVWIDPSKVGQGYIDGSLQVTQLTYKVTRDICLVKLKLRDLDRWFGYNHGRYNTSNVVGFGRWYGNGQWRTGIEKFRKLLDPQFEGVYFIDGSAHGVILWSENGLTLDATLPKNTGMVRRDHFQ